MPCDQENVLSVEFHSKNQKILDKALETLGWTQNGQRINAENGSIYLSEGQARGNAEDVNLLRVTYAKTTLSMAAQMAKGKDWGVQIGKNGKLTLNLGRGKF